MFRLLWVIFRHKFQDLLYILFYSLSCKAICTTGLEVYAWRWLIRFETCSKVNIYVILKLSKYIILLCRRKIYCRYTINRLSYHTTGWLLLDYIITSLYFYSTLYIYVYSMTALYNQSPYSLYMSVKLVALRRWQNQWPKHVAVV